MTATGNDYATGTTTQQVNAGQLCDLLGVTSLTILGAPSDPSRTVEAECAQATLDSVLASYTYDPNYVLANASAADKNAASLRQKALTALSNNQTYLGVASPTNAQVRDQVAALTRQTNGIIRLLLNQVDSTAGT